MNGRAVIRLLVFILLLAETSFAASDEAETRLKTAVNDVLAIADRASTASGLANSLRPVLYKYVSFDAMTRRAVGLGWRQFSSDQQKKAVDLFTTLVIRTYSGKFTPGQHATISFKPATTPAPGRVEVPTSVLYEGSHYQVVYRMEQSEGWRITDVVIEGVSLVANYRAQFDAEFKKGGANAVIDALSNTVASR